MIFNPLDYTASRARSRSQVFNHPYDVEVYKHIIDGIDNVALSGGNSLKYRFERDSFPNFRSIGDIIEKLRSNGFTVEVKSDRNIFVHTTISWEMN